MSDLRASDREIAAYQAAQAMPYELQLVPLSTREIKALLLLLSGDDAEDVNVALSILRGERWDHAEQLMGALYRKLSKEYADRLYGGGGDDRPPAD